MTIRTRIAPWIISLALVAGPSAVLASEVTGTLSVGTASGGHTSGTIGGTVIGGSSSGSGSSGTAETPRGGGGRPIPASGGSQTQNLPLALGQNAPIAIAATVERSAIVPNATRSPTVASAPDDGVVFGDYVPTETTPPAGDQLPGFTAAAADSLSPGARLAWILAAVLVALGIGYLGYRMYRTRRAANIPEE